MKTFEVNWTVLNCSGGFFHLLRVDEFLHWVTRSGAARHPWLFEWHPSRLFAENLVPGYTSVRLETPEIPEQVWTAIAQDVGSKLLTPQDIPEFSRPSMGLASGNWHRRESAACEGHENTRRGVVRAGHALAGLVGFIPGFTWAFARRTRSSPGYHIRGLQPRQGSGLHPINLWRGDSGPRAEGRGRIIPETQCGFVPQSAGGELLMSHDCPEFSRPNMGFSSRNWCRRAAAGEGDEGTRRGLARAGHALIGLVGFIPGFTWAFARRTRSSLGYHIGGLQPRQGSSLRSIRLRRGDGGSRPEGKGQIIPESQCGFVLQSADGELLMPHDCPEFSHPNMGFASRNWCWRAAAAGEGCEDTRRRMARVPKYLDGFAS